MSPIELPYRWGHYSVDTYGFCFKQILGKNRVLRDMIKPKDENQTCQRCSVSSKTKGSWSTTYQLREDEHSVNTGESFIQIPAWKKNSKLKSHCVTGHSIKSTYILYNIVSSYLGWKEHPCLSNIGAFNSMPCLWAHCQIHCIHIGTDFSFWAVHFLHSSRVHVFFLFFYQMDVLGRPYFTEWRSLSKNYWGGHPSRWSHPWSRALSWYWTTTQQLTDIYPAEKKNYKHINTQTYWYLSKIIHKHFNSQTC